MSVADPLALIALKLLPELLRTPLAYISFFVMLCLAYGIDFLLFTYRDVKPRPGPWVRFVVGAGYVALVGLLTNLPVFLNPEAPPTVDQIVARIPGTLVVGPALFFVVFVVTLLWKGGGRH